MNLGSRDAALARSIRSYCTGACKGTILGCYSDCSLHVACDCFQEMPVIGYMQELALQPLISHKAGGKDSTLTGCQRQAQSLVYYCISLHSLRVYNRVKRVRCWFKSSLHEVVDHVARTAASRALAECSFSVSIADPSQPDMPLVAVSPTFEAMTGRMWAHGRYWKKRKKHVKTIVRHRRSAKA